MVLAFTILLKTLTIIQIMVFVSTLFVEIDMWGSPWFVLNLASYMVDLEISSCQS